MKKMGGKSGVLWEIGGDFCATFQYNEDWICLLRRRDMYLRYVICLQSKRDIHPSGVSDMKRVAFR